MRILIVGTLYEPDLGPSAPLFTQLSQELVKRGHQVSVITTVPHYYSGRVAVGYRGFWHRRSREHGVDVLRIGLPSVDRSRLPLRLLQFLTYQVGAAVAGITARCDVVIAGGPSLSVGLPFAVLAALRRKPAVYVVQDVYPDIGIKLGFFRHSAVIKLVTLMETFCLRRASTVQIISESFRPPLRRLGVPDRKMAFVPNWVDTEAIRPLPRDNGFSREHRLGDRFVVLYAGNMGFSQGLEHVLLAAEALADQRDILFVLIGDGGSREALTALAAARQIRNVLFLPFQPRGRLPEVLASADISLVTLRCGLGFDSVPSKILSILSSGRPILAGVDEDCEAWTLVRDAGAGVCVPPENPSALARAILDLKSHRALREEYGGRGRAWAERHHSPQGAARMFEDLLTRALQAGRAPEG